MDTLESSLRELGDPSGHSDAPYWDAWFNVVCPTFNSNHPKYNSDTKADLAEGTSCSNNHDSQRRHFEWYVDGVEVARVLRSFCFQVDVANLANDDENIYVGTTLTPKMIRFIHPGSGNSAVPLQLAYDSTLGFKSSQHTIVDVSQVALGQMCDAADGLLKRNSESASIRCDYGDVLDTPLCYPGGSFDVWLDKGLHDALFGSAGCNDKDKSRSLFREILRLLACADTSTTESSHERRHHYRNFVEDVEKGNNKHASLSSKLHKGGTALIISMAQDHSLQLIIDGWLSFLPRLNDNDDSCLEEGAFWRKSLNIYEMVPTSGQMTPFGFFLQKAAKQSDMPSNVDSEQHLLVNLHKVDGSILQKRVTITDNCCDREATYACISEMLKKLLSNDSNKSDRKGNSNNSLRRVLASIEIKPVGPHVDLTHLSRRITSTDYFLDPILKNTVQWQSQSNDDSDKINDLNKAKYGIIKPIGFGISKLVLNCIVDSDKLNSLCEDIMKQEGSFPQIQEDDNFGDKNDIAFGAVQSVDIDWSNTVPIGNPYDFASALDKFMT